MWLFHQSLGFLPSVLLSRSNYRYHHSPAVNSKRFPTDAFGTSGGSTVKSVSSSEAFVGGIVSGGS